jgi:hypothetical protein
MKSNPTWTRGNELSLRAEVERRFRLRTPAKDIIDADWRYRVPRTEIRAIAQEMQLGALPELDEEWARQFGRWYTKMAHAAATKAKQEAL